MATSANLSLQRAQPAASWDLPSLQSRQAPLRRLGALLRSIRVVPSAAAGAESGVALEQQPEMR
eukprot:COSAG02_NODE_30895_length_543_cov_0.864865_1_plen_63_part_10